jgi:hypothetical protein
VQLWPGDELSWSCTFNTSTTNRTVMGACLEVYVLHRSLHGVLTTTAHRFLAWFGCLVLQQDFLLSSVHVPAIQQGLTCVV